MSGQQPQNGWAIHSSFNHPREKHRHLGASLLLTSSFAHHKQQLSRQKRQRMEQQANKHAGYHQQVLQAKRINETKQVGGNQHHHVHALSSINDLKTHARKLMDEQTTKLGKENESQMLQEPRTMTAVSKPVEPLPPFKACKKPNKRRIVKGRPEMYAVTRKRAFLLNLLDDERPQNQAEKGIVNQLLNKNNLLKFISTQNERSESHNLYENLERHKTIEQASAPKRHTQGHRKSLINFSQGARARLQHLSKQIQEDDDEPFKEQGFILKKRRYSSIKTIE